MRSFPSSGLAHHPAGRPGVNSVPAEHIGRELFLQHGARDVFNRPGLAIGAIVEQGIEAAVRAP